MTIKELHNRLKSEGIPPSQYHLHGLLGSVDDNEKFSMNITAGKHFAEYEVYFKERGLKLSSWIFTDETKACQFFLKKMGINP